MTTPPRFCMSNVIAYGQTFLDLVLHVGAYIRQNIRISYDPPNAKRHRFAQSVVHLALAKQFAKPDSEWKRKFLRKINLFLLLFNGNWKNWDRAGLVHHCSITCPCGGLRRQALADKAAECYVEIVLCSRPPIPALSRWLKCSETAKWYLNLGFQPSHMLFQIMLILLN